MDTLKKVTGLLNRLIEINNDRIEGYERAAKETDDTDLKSLFTSMAAKSRSIKSELVSEVTKRGGEATESTTTSGKAYRVWMDFKAAVTGKDRKAILSSCEFGEDAAQATYKEVLDSNDLPADLMTMVRQQKVKLDDDHHHVKEMRDQEVHAHH